MFYESAAMTSIRAKTVKRVGADSMLCDNIRFICRVWMKHPTSSESQFPKPKRIKFKLHPEIEKWFDEECNQVGWIV